MNVFVITAVPYRLPAESWFLCLSLGATTVYNITYMWEREKESEREEEKKLIS